MREWRARSGLPRSTIHDPAAAPDVLRARCRGRLVARARVVACTHAWSAHAFQDHQRPPLPPRGARSARHRRHPLEGEGRRPAGERPRLAARAAGEALRAGHLGAAADLPGDGRRRQGQHDQARDVRPQPAGLRRLLVQGAVGRGTGARLSLAHDRPRCRSAATSASSTGPTTRKCWSCACIRRFSARQRLPPAVMSKTDLDGALRGHRRLRAASRGGTASRC